MAQYLLGRIVSHAKKVNQTAEAEAALAGVFDSTAQEKRDRFAELARRVVEPAFEEFKSVMRQVGRDAVIVSKLTHHPKQSVTLILVDRYLKIGKQKTLNLVNPKDDVTQKMDAKFYEVFRDDEFVCVRERAVPQLEPISTPVTYEDVVPEFLENELARFFERAYPTSI